MEQYFNFLESKELWDERVRPVESANSSWGGRIHKLQLSEPVRGIMVTWQGYTKWSSL